MKDSGSIVLFIVIAIGFISLGYYLLIGRANKRASILKDFALGCGFKFNEYDCSNLIKEKITFIQHSNSVFIYNVMSCKNKDGMIYLFDVGIRASSQRSAQESICLVEADNFNFDGHIQIVNRDNQAMYEFIHRNRDLTEVVIAEGGLFNQRYIVCSNNKERALKIINPTAQAHLLEHNKNWKFTCELFGNKALVRAPQLKELEDLRYLLDFTKGLIL